MINHTYAWSRQSDTGFKLHVLQWCESLCGFIVIFQSCGSLKVCLKGFVWGTYQYFHSFTLQSNGSFQRVTELKSEWIYALFTATNSNDKSGYFALQNMEGFGLPLYWSVSLCILWIWTNAVNNPKSHKLTGQCSSRPTTLIFCKVKEPLLSMESIIPHSHLNCHV